MDFFDNLRGCLQATQSANTELRQRAESEIRSLRDQDPKKFMATLTRDIADESLDVGSRQMACIIFKNFIINRSGDSKYEGYWINLDTQFRVQVKEAITTMLASPQALVRSQIANVVAAIATIEIPRKEWLDLLPNLCTNAEHTEQYVRLASLTTLGYICEEIEPEHVVDEVKNRIILALVNNIGPPGGDGAESAEPCRLAIRALSNAVPYANQNFKAQNERDYIMGKILSVCAAEVQVDEEILEHALQCLREISTLEYESVQWYFAGMCAATARLAGHPSPRVGAQAYEFWTTLAEDETERKTKNVFCKNYVESCKDDLIGFILRGLLAVDEDEEEEDWGPGLSAGCCLQKLAVLIGNHVLQPVVTYVAANISANDWKQKYAALIALGSITEGPDKQSFLDIVLPTLAGLLEMFKDPHAKVREAISWVMSRICEHHADVATGPQVAPQVLPVLKDALRDKPRISNQCCAAFEKLAAACQPLNEEPSNCLTPYFSEILEVLFNNATREDYHGAGVDLMQASYMTMTAMVQSACSSSEEVVYNLLVPVLQTLESTLLEQMRNPEKAKNMQDQLCALLQVTLIKAGPKVNADLSTKIVQLLIKIFDKTERVTENALIAFQGLCVGAGEHIDLSEIGKYLKYALESQDDYCAKLACGIISDLAGAMQDRLNQYLEDFVPCLHTILRSQDTDRKIKLPALQALGDLSLNSGDQFNQRYLTETLVILNAAASMSTQLEQIPHDDQDTYIFLADLRESLLEQYGTILIAISDSTDAQQKTIFQQYLVSICDFLEATLKIEGDSSEETLRGVAALMLDMSTHYSQDQQLKAKLQQPYVEQLLNALQAYPDPESQETAVNTYQAITALGTPNAAPY